MKTEGCVLKTWHDGNKTKMTERLICFSVLNQEEKPVFDFQVFFSTFSEVSYTAQPFQMSGVS